jgi:peptide chain release factor 3
MIRETLKLEHTLTEGEIMSFKGIQVSLPTFQIHQQCRPMKAKQLDKGIDQLMDEGVAQLFVLK